MNCGLTRLQYVMIVSRCVDFNIPAEVSFHQHGVRVCVCVCVCVRGGEI